MLLSQWKCSLQKNFHILGSKINRSECSGILCLQALTYHSNMRMKKKDKIAIERKHFVSARKELILEELQNNL